MMGPYYYKFKYKKPNHGLTCLWQLKQKSKGFKANTYQSDPPLDLQNSQYIFTVLAVQKNIRRMLSTFSRLAMNKNGKHT